MYTRSVRGLSYHRVRDVATLRDLYEESYASLEGYVVNYKIQREVLVMIIYADYIGRLHNSTIYDFPLKRYRKVITLSTYFTILSTATVTLPSSINIILYLYYIVPIFYYTYIDDDIVLVSSFVLRRAPLSTAYNTNRAI